MSFMAREVLCKATLGSQKPRLGLQSLEWIFQRLFVNHQPCSWLSIAHGHCALDSPNL